MKFKKKEFKNIKQNFEHGLKYYSKNFRSKHWEYMVNKKKNLYKTSNLKNFRKNNLSFGLDDQYYSIKEFHKNFSDLLKTCGKNYVLKYLNSTNIGNVKNFLNYKKRLVDRHDIFFIKYLYDLEKNINFKNIKWICDIGSGYGGLISKLYKKKKFKIIAIDLPESHFLSAYYLKSLHPKIKILYSFQIKKKINSKELKKYDLFLIYPWDIFPSQKIDLFINTRSMMEMNIKVIKKYFDLIQSKSKNGSYFLNINRYYKDTTGYPIEYHKYPYDNFWKIKFSKSSWRQEHIHSMLTIRTKNSHNDINNEQKKIKKIMLKKIKSDTRFVRRVLPNSIYKIYKFMKGLIIKN